MDETGRSYNVCIDLCLEYTLYPKILFTTYVHAYPQGSLQTPFVHFFSVGHMFKNKHLRLTDEVVLNPEANSRIH